jgi:hypothetical protein
MRKRSFLLPLAVSLTALTAGTAVASAKPVVSTAATLSETVSPSPPTVAEPLVLKRTKIAQYGHSSHASHASHSSHSSHHSSR